MIELNGLSASRKVSKLIVGTNDLATLHPDVAAEAFGWDPSQVQAGSHKRCAWKCREQHVWQAIIKERVGNQNRNGTSCPYCKNRKVWEGFNDLKTHFPEVAKEACGWDPSKVLFGSHKKMPWKCQKGHAWEAKVVSRTANHRGCPYCTNQKLLVGFNDLKTLFPEVAKEANGWDPTTISPGSHKKMSWMCAQGHSWKAVVGSRTLDKKGCPFCSNRKVWTGFNDLQTVFPEIAKEANGWDPTIVIAGTNKKMSWKCKEGHIWNVSPNARISSETMCPYCKNRKVWEGFNDLKTHFPEVAKEADGWNPSKVLFGSHKKMPWKCQKGHKWSTSIHSRTEKRGGTDCPECAESGYNPSKPGWFYLMEREGEQQLGITNFLTQRLSYHKKEGWREIEISGPHSGHIVLETENALKEWLRKYVGLVPNKKENWYTSKMEVHSLSELKEKSGIDISIF